MSRLYISILTLLLSAACAMAQTIQRGIVVEYNEENVETPLSNVEIVVANAGSTVTNEKGEFTLRFRQLQPGDRVMVRRIYKVGYEVFNTESVEQWYISSDDRLFRIELCRSEYLLKYRNRLITQADHKIATRLEEDKKKLNIDLERNTISKEEYDKRLEKLQRDYEKKLSNIDTYIDRFVHINLSTLDENEKQIIAYVQEGEYDKAIELYEKEQLIEKLTRQGQNVKRLDEASEAFAAKERELDEARSQIRNSVFRQIDLMRMQGGDKAYKKVVRMYQDLAMADSTDVINLLYYARMLAAEANNEEAIAVYRTIANVAREKGDSLNMLRSECYQAKQLMLIGRITEGITRMEHSLPLFDSLRLQQADTLTLLLDEVDFWQALGTRYAVQARYEMAHEQYGRALHALQSLRKEISMQPLESQYAAFMVQSAANMARSKWGKTSIEDIKEGIRVLEQLYADKPYKYEARLAFAYGNLGLVCSLDQNVSPENQEIAEQAFKQSVEHYRKAVEHYPAAYNRFYASQLSNLGEYYIKNKQYDKALGCLKESQEAWVKEPDIENVKYAHKLSNVHYNLGNCYYFLGDMQNALKYDQIALDEMEPLYEMEPDTYRERMGTRLLHLCNTYRALGELDKAYAFVLRAMEVDPTYPETQEIYKMLKEKLGK